MMKFSIFNSGRAALVAALLLLGGVCSFAAPPSAAKSNRTVMTKKNVNKQKKMVNSFESPDFAFPETVEKNALPQWEKALKNRDGLLALRAGMQVIAARNSVSADNINANVEMLDSAIKVMPPVYASLLRLLEADLYKSFYERNRWTYNQRTLPTDTFPEDPRTWSRALFAEKVYDIVRNATDNIMAAREMPLTDITKVLGNYQTAVNAGCSVYDFIIFKSSSLLDTFTGTGDEDKFRDLSTALLTTLVNYRKNADNTPALVLAVSRKAETLPDDERLAFLKEWKDRLAGDAADGRLINEYYQFWSGRSHEDYKEGRTLRRQMEEWIARFPNASGVEAVKYSLARLTQPSIQAVIPGEVLPGSEVKASLTVENAHESYLLVYEVYELTEAAFTNGDFNVSKFPGNAKFRKAVPVKTGGEIPFSATFDIKLGSFPAGYYVVVPSRTPSLASNWRDLADRWSIQPVNVTEIALFTNYDTNSDKSGKIFVVKATNQEPIEGAVVTITDNRNKVISSGKTLSDGSFPLPKGYSRVKATYGGSSVSTYTGFSVYRNDFKANPACSIFTDLSVYRPGDKMNFLLVEWLADRFSSRLLSGEKVDVVLRDANYNPVDTLSLTTDADGRCKGSFTIPSSGLLGRYVLEAVSEGKNTIGRTGFEVAEYKTPGFIVSLEKDGAKSYEAGDTVTFKGDASTFSGMPLADAKVQYKVSWQPWWRWGGDYSDKTFGGETVTGNDGKFSIDFATDRLKGSRFEHGIFTLDVSVTSPSGETQSAPGVRFSLGKDYSVRPAFPDVICVEGDTVSLNVPVYDMLNLPVKKMVEYKLQRFSENKEGELSDVAKGSFMSPSLTFPASQLPSGKYRLQFNVEGDTLINTTDVIFYRKDDPRPPYSLPIWTPQREYYAPEGSKNVEVTVGSGYADSWVLAVISGPDGIISREWVKIDNSNVKISVPAPEEGSKRWLMVAGMRDFDQEISTITVAPESAKRKLSVKASTFRDRITAGGKEKWKFTFSVGEKGVSGLPAFAVMTDKALNSIMPFRWSFNPSRGYVANITSMSHFSNGMVRVSGRFSKLPKYASFQSFIPYWNFYANASRQELLSTVMTTSRSMVKDEVFDAVEEQVLYEAPVMNSAMKMAAPRVKGGGVMTESAADDAYEEEADGVSEAGATAGGAGMEMQLRPMEMPLAFFMPALKADKDGNVEVEFEVPDFNTTWQFQIMGYTPDLLTAGTTLETTASKAVMVQTNAPRFLRTGDTAQISALVFNNTDKPAKLDGEIVLFNPVTNETIYSKHQGAETVAPSESRKITLSFVVPADLNAIGLRTIGKSEDFSDGEQTVVPVLPSSTPVTEAVQFYLGRDRNSFTTRLPKYPADANLTLRYCSNPVWECILALPSIMTPDSKNVLTLMEAVYANSTASFILNRNPYIKESLASLFRKGGDDAALTSNLEKNSDLKAVALNNTPWVNNAASETTRLHSLSQLLEENNAEKAVEKLLNDVKGLQNNDGGWSWCEGMKSSEFITRRVLERFSMMARNASLSSEAASMVKKGVAYCDRKVYEDYVKSKHKFSTTDMLHYLYIRSSLNAGNGPAGFPNLRTKALKAIEEEWKGFGIYDKSLAAMLLARTKGYERTAGVILESLKQFATKDADKGWNFDNLASGVNGWNRLSVTSAVLEAFSEIEPAADAVDGLSQWLVLQKETEDWGSNPNTVEVIQAILESGSDRVDDNVAPEIKLSGKSLASPSSEALTGIVTLSLSPKEASGKELSIMKSSGNPMWGGVISQYVAPVKDVKAQRCENLRIEKQLLLLTAEGKGEQAVNGPLKTGDKVRVTLTVTCDKDMDYVAIIDDRPACLQPDSYISGYTFRDGLGIYKEVRDTKTSLFIGFLPKGANVITYDCHVDRPGLYANGIATVQSQYSPQQVAHSAGEIIEVK